MLKQVFQLFLVPRFKLVFWKYAEMWLLCIVFLLPVVHLMGSTRYADLRKDFTFQCVVHYAVNLVDDIKFFKDKTLVGSLFQEMNRCGLSCKEISPRFKLSCGEGTNLVESFNKTYILHVANITADDATAWTCGIANRFVRSNLTTFKLDVTGEADFQPCTIVELINIP